MAYPLLDDGRAGPPGRRADVDVASTGEEVSAFVAAGDGARSRLLSDQFADAVTDITAQTVLRIHAEAHQWRLPGLGKQVREALGNPVRSHGFVPPLTPPCTVSWPPRVSRTLHVAVWLPDLDALYDFLTADLAGLDVSAAETILVGRVIKRPGLAGGRACQTGA